MLGLGVLTLNWMTVLLLPFTRIAAFMVAAPLFGQAAANVRLRAIYVFALCVLVLPQGLSIASPVRQYPEANALLVASEALLGAAMGLVLQLVSAAVVTAGEQISSAVGISFSQSFDPTIGPTPVLSRLLNLVALLAFVGAEGHTVVISMLLDSLRAVPPGTAFQVDYRALLEFSTVIFKGAALLAAPLLLALLAVNVALGVLSKATPSLNIFAIGFAANLLVGFGMLLFSIPGMVERMSELWNVALEFEKTHFLR